MTKETRDTTDLDWLRGAVVQGHGVSRGKRWVAFQGGLIENVTEREWLLMCAQARATEMQASPDRSEQ